MDYLDAWRGRLPDALRAFAAVEDDPAVSLQYGVLAGGVLWAVRDDAGSSDLHAALTRIADGADTAPLSEILSQLSNADPLRAARLLTERARADRAIQGLLDRVVLCFLDDYLRFGLVRRAPGGITVAGDVTGANVVIGGQQYIGGDLVVTRARAWSCPTAPNPPAHFAGDVREGHDVPQRHGGGHHRGTWRRPGRWARSS